MNQLKYWLGWVQTVLLGSLRKVERKENKVRLPQTRTIMQWLRERAKIIRLNNLKINEWVDDYIDDCVRNGREITLLTQLCISKDLEVRYQKQSNAFVPTKQERQLFEKEIPQIVEALQKNGIRFNWWMTYNRSYLNSGRLEPDLENKFKQMISQLAEPFLKQGWLIVADWEDEIICKRPEPNQEVLRDIGKFISSSALSVEVKRHSSWAREEAGLDQTDEELRRDVYFQIACEAEEALTLFQTFGEFILVPLEVPERYVFFYTLVPNLQKQIMAVLKPYPWRLNSNG
ncbi:MAG: hypothetical protein AAB801_01270 [Patescibacteria group bacterium]